MKKFLSLMLALLMLALPVFSMAEAAEPADVAEPAETEAGLSLSTETLTGLLEKVDFSSKYLLQGQAMTMDFSMQVGDFLMSMVPEEYRQPIADLLSALKIEVSGQTSGHEVQGAFRLLLNDESAVDMIAAVNRTGLYATSGLLGDQIFQVTPAQIKGLVNQYAEQMVAAGQITQEQLDLVKESWRSFRADPKAFILEQIGSPDLSGLLTALLTLVTTEGMEEVAEIPEGVLIDAKYVMTMRLSRESLVNLMNETVNVLWSMPGVQKLAAFMPVNGTPVTEERLHAAFAKVAGALAEDMIIKCYMNEAGNAMQYCIALKVTDGEEISQGKASIAFETLETGTIHVVYTLDVPKQDQEMIMNYEMAIIPQETGAEVSYDAVATLKQGDTEYTPIREGGTLTLVMQEAERDVSLTGNVYVQPQPGAQPMGILYTAAGTEKDLGDHAEENVTARFELEGMGEVFSMNAEAKTGLAEAYIITDDAVQPLAMSQEELAELWNTLQQKLMIGAFSIIPKLPESVQMFVTQLMGGQPQE